MRTAAPTATAAATQTLSSSPTPTSAPFAPGFSTEPLVGTGGVMVTFRSTTGVLEETVSVLEETVSVLGETVRVVPLGCSVGMRAEVSADDSVKFAEGARSVWKPRCDTWTEEISISRFEASWRRV